MPTVAEIVADFADCLKANGFLHLLGGSFASGAWGDARPTGDADFAIWLAEGRTSELIEALGPRCPLEPSEVAEAIASREEFASFQVLDVEEAFKFDLFLAGRSPIDREAQELARPVEISPGRPILTACPEHIFVLKLRWFEADRRTSERQWRDMVGIVRTTRSLDRSLVARWSSRFGLSDLAVEVLVEADLGHN